jgi:hypothetical protein
MIYNLVSSKRLLSKLYRDLKPKNTSFEADAIEWIGEALSFIGYQAGFIKRKITLTSKDYRVPFPKDFYTLIAVYYEDNKLPYSGDIVNAEPYLDEAIYISAKTEVLETTNTTVTRYGSRLYNTNSTDYNYYTINPGYIQTSFETGDIDVVYNAWPTDSEGLPLIPDSPYYFQAIEWYIMRQMIFQGHEFSNKEFSFSFVDAQWKHYCVSAGNDAAFPSPDKVARFMDMWVHLIPDINVDFDNIVTKDTHETI